MLLLCFAPTRHHQVVTHLVNAGIGSESALQQEVSLLMAFIVIMLISVQYLEFR